MKLTVSFLLNIPTLSKNCACFPPGEYFPSIPSPHTTFFLLQTDWYLFVCDVLCRYLDVIIESCKKMEAGMADYAHKAQTTGSVYVEKVEEYDLYCHYVAGLVGEGLSKLFAASGKEGKFLAGQLELSNSMGLFLQKTNIIRDFREDVDEHRYFWPREIWGDAKYGTAAGGNAFQEMREMYLEGNEKQAEYVQSAMILNAMCHVTDTLDYLRLLKNQSVFNFCAIPQTMAIATLELCFKNPAMFQRNIKIRKSLAADVRLFNSSPLCERKCSRIGADGHIVFFLCSSS